MSDGENPDAVWGGEEWAVMEGERVQRGVALVLWGDRGC